MYWLLIVQLLTFELIVAGTTTYELLKGTTIRFENIIGLIVASVLVAMIILVRHYENKWLRSSNKLVKFFMEIYYIVMTLVLMFSILPTENIFVMGALHKWLHLNVTAVFVLLFIYGIFMYIPTIAVITKNIKWVVSRVLMMALVLFQLVGMYSFYSSMDMGNKTLSMLENTGIVGAVAFAVMISVLMIEWGFRLPKFSFSKNSSWSTNLFLLLFAAWYVIYNAFAYSEKLSTTLFKYDFSVKSPTWHMAFQGLEAGIAEEWLWRFAVGLLLLFAFKNSKHSFLRRYFIEWSVGIGGLLFGLWHFDNMFAGQNVLGTVDQMLSAAAAGWLFMVIYFYTNNLLSTIVFHFLIDALSFIASGTTFMDKPNLFEWETTVIQIIVFGLITVFMLTGKRRKVIKENVSGMLERS
ncbi:CAAX amino terminal protease family [Pediococcus claussenii ATCC BAA-344]|uniref:CAAX amino terminal protease family n=2 Tax=Pediococcus claussenii TaxID=187452 RepID=G8PB43_PEDCP|nr:CAAX amino terminal protease family [Pediococcus claussenii ATCC BAA-344]KRN20851.1 hypothetical protein IV79_GL000073 [Pediococcus claussenii]